VNLLLYAIGFLTIVQVSCVPVSTENEKDYNLQNEDQSILKFLQINYIFKIFSNLAAIDIENMEKEKRGILIGNINYLFSQDLAL